MGGVSQDAEREPGEWYVAGQGCWQRSWREGSGFCVIWKFSEKGSHRLDLRVWLGVDSRMTPSFWLEHLVPIP